MRTIILLACLALLGRGGSAQSTPPKIDGRYLLAYEVAARQIRGDEESDLRWRDPGNYTVVFEGEKNGRYVLHFYPKGPPVVEPGLDHDPRNGLPLRIYVRKSDLKFIEGVVE